MPNSILRSFSYSANGLRLSWQGDASFRRSALQVGAGFVVASGLFYVLPLNIGAWLVLVASLLPIVIVELLNTAIEAVTDKASPERSELAEKAKDVGSAAVLMTRALTLLCWSVVLINAFSTP
jgi:diacylglycerol kinase (ATP)